jgi:hypothetical protein
VINRDSHNGPQMRPTNLQSLVSFVNILHKHEKIPLQILISQIGFTDSGGDLKCGSLWSSNAANNWIYILKAGIQRDGQEHDVFGGSLCD